MNWLKRLKRLMGELKPPPYKGVQYPDYSNIKPCPQSYFHRYPHSPIIPDDFDLKLLERPGYDSLLSYDGDYYQCSECEKDFDGVPFAVFKQDEELILHCEGCYYKEDEPTATPTEDELTDIAYDKLRRDQGV